MKRFDLFRLNRNEEEALSNKFQPYWYQSECLENLSEIRAQGKKRGLVVMATGTGKTAVAAFDARDFIKHSTSPRVLFICHQSEILVRARETFEEILGDQYSYGFFHGKSKSEPTSTNILFATFQTLGRYLNQLQADHFDYIVVDESHHSQAETYKPVVDHFDPSFMLGITATPDRSDLKDIRRLFGKEVYSLPLEKAIALNLLAKIDYRVITASPNEHNIEKLRQIPNSSLTIPLIDKELFEPLKMDVVISIIKEKTTGLINPRIMIFTPSVEESDRIALLMGNSKPLHSRMKESRPTVMNEFKQGDICGVTVVDIFNEGIDIPETNVLVFLRSTSSRTIYLQQLGRGLRKVDGKDSVLVLDFVANCARIQMVDELWRRVNEERAYVPADSGAYDSTTEKPYDFDFSEVSVDILQIIGQAIANEASYTKEALIEEIQRITKELGKSPTRRDVDALSAQGQTASSATYIRRFGSFNEALRQAGLTTNKDTADIKSDETLLSDLKGLASTLGKTPTLRDVNEFSQTDRSIASATTYIRRFGSFNDALIKAGLDPSREALLSKSDEELLEELRLLAIRLGKIPSKRELDNFGKNTNGTGSSTYIRRFGSYSNAVRMAGLIPG